MCNVAVDQVTYYVFKNCLIHIILHFKIIEISFSHKWSSLAGRIFRKVFGCQVRNKLHWK